MAMRVPDRHLSEYPRRDHELASGRVGYLVIHSGDKAAAGQLAPSQF